MKRLLLFLLPVAFLLASCSQESEPTIKEKENPSASSTRVSLEAALKAAEQMFEGLEGDATRAASRKVKSVETIGTEATRSSESDALYYVVNYDDNAGFAVLGADTRLDAVYAISEEGSLNMNDTVFNGGLNLFFRSLPSDPNKLPGIGNGGVEKPDSTIIGISDIKPLHQDVSVKRGPFLAPAVRKWKQTGRFADCTPNHSPVGCVALASAQIMSSHKWPEQYNGKHYNWDVINQWDGVSDYSQDANLPYLLYEIGKLLQLNYSATAGSLPYDKIYRILLTFQTMGYTVTDEFRMYTPDELSSFIVNFNKPIMILGRLNLGGHAWVCDGSYYDLHKYLQVNGSYSYQSNGYFYHLVWGWEGRANGYYKFGDSFTYSDYISEPDDYYNSDTSWTNVVKNNNLKFWGNAVPNK